VSSRRWPAIALLVAAAGCRGADPVVMVPPLPLDAGLVGDAGVRPIAVVGDRVSDRLELYSIDPLSRVAALSVDDNPGWIDEPFDLARSPDGASIYVVLGHGVAWTTGKLVRIRLADGVRTGEVALGEEPSMIALAADGKRAYVSLFKNLAHPQGPWSDAGALVAVDTEAMRVTGQVDVCAAALGVALDEAAGRVYAACAGAGAIAVVDVSGAAPRLASTLPLDDGSGSPGAQAAYLALDGANLYATAQGSGDLWIFDRATLALRRRIAFGSDAFPQRMALTADGSLLLVAIDASQRLAAVSTSALVVADTLALAGVHPQGLALSPDGRFALVTDENDLKNPGRLARVALAGLGAGGARLDATAPATVFPQAVIVVP
jgi:DNA-binding beta-propeller fold protein YncE